MQRQTTIAKSEKIERKWYVIDATDIPYGRLASFVAVKLMGKDKPIYTPNVDCGDYVTLRVIYIRGKSSCRVTFR